MCAEYSSAAGQVQGGFRNIGQNDDGGGDNGDSDGATVSSGGGSSSSGSKTGHATFYAGMGGGGPIAACGVPIDVRILLYRYSSTMPSGHPCLL